MSRFTVLVVLCLFLSSTTDGQDLPPRQGVSRMMRPFNGADLTGWIGDDTHWTVDDGRIVGRSTGALTESTFLLLDGEVSDFRLTFEIKPGASGNSGVAFWGSRSTDNADDYTYTGPLLTLPENVAVYDLNGSGLLKDLTPEPAPVATATNEDASASTDSPQNLNDTSSDDVGWSRVEVLAQGNRVRLVVNGRLRLDGRLPAPEKLLAGPIGLLLPGSEVAQEVCFRKLTLELFPEE